MSEQQEGQRMNPETAQMLRDKVEWEGGLDYTFRFYSQFPEIEDERFRKLVGAYVAAAQALVDYCGLDDEPEELEEEPDEEPGDDSGG